MFTDRDVLEDAPRVAEALEKADAFFASLVFDYDNVSVQCYSTAVQHSSIYCCMHICILFFSLSCCCESTYLHTYMR